MSHTPGIDDELVETVMKQDQLSTKREAIDTAVHKRPTTEDLRALRGIGWPMSNEEIEGDEGAPGHEDRAVGQPMCG